LELVKDSFISTLTNAEGIIDGFRKNSCVMKVPNNFQFLNSVWHFVSLQDRKVI